MFIPIRQPQMGMRMTRLIGGLTMFGVGIGLMAQSELGLPPWDVLHQGLVSLFGGSIGGWSIIVSFIVIIPWIPLREPIGIGTVLNGLLIGAFIDVTIRVVDIASTTPGRWTMLLVGTLLIGVGSGFYIGANLGPGPRDGLMTGIAKRGYSIGLVRAVIEVSVLVAGIALGGTFGIGTVIFAFAIGPAVQYFLARLTMH